MSRQQDLEELIRRSYQIIVANESLMQTEQDPQRKLSQSDKVQENWKSIDGYVAEYVPLILSHSIATVPSDIEQIILRFPKGAKLAAEQAKLLRRKIVSHWQAWEGVTDTIDRLQRELSVAETAEKRLELQVTISELTQKQFDLERDLIQQDNSLNELVLTSAGESGFEINRFRVIQIQLDSVNTIVGQIDAILDRIPRQLAPQFDRLSQQIESLKKELMAAIKEGRREDIEDLSKELEMQLKRQQERQEKRSSLHNTGLSQYESATKLLQTGSADEATALFDQAKVSFTEAVELSTLADPDMQLYLLDLGNSLAMLGKQEESIPYYELAIQIAPHYEPAHIELAKRHFELGQKQYAHRAYSLAAHSFELAQMWVPKNEEYRQWTAHALNEEANTTLASRSIASLSDWDRAKSKMIRAIYLHPEMERYHNNLKTIQNVRGRPNTVITIGHETLPAEKLPTDQKIFEVYVDEGAPEKLSYWLELFLPEFRELAVNTITGQRPAIHVWWLGTDDKSIERLAQIGIQSAHTSSIALSHVVEGQHYIVLNSEYFANLDERCLLGTLFHELSHEAWKTLSGVANFPDWTVSSITHFSSERIADLLTIYKGLGEFLLVSRKQLEGSEGTEGDYPAMTSAELARILRRDRETEAKRFIIEGAELVQKGQQNTANGYFASSANIWKWVLRQDPGYAFGWYELAIVLDWLGETDAAVRHAFIASSLDRNPRYRTFYDRLTFTREQEAREHIAQGATLKKRGQVKKAQQLFQLAEAIWVEIAEEYFDVGRVHWELGLCYEWQDRIEDAIHEYAIAVSLDRANEKYSQYLRACVARYSLV
jgi:tetratricopeptide (TPR) repeat protein